MKELDKSALRGLALAGGIAAIGGLATFATPTAVSRASIIGLTKLSGTAGNLQAGKFVAIANRFATNPKTIGLTSSLFSKAGTSIGAASLAVGIIGSYPFAGFIKEEALQTLSFAVTTARNAGDMEGEQEVIDQVNEVLNPSAWHKILAAIPFANVYNELKDFYKAAATKNAADQESLNRRREEQARIEEQGESDFEKQRRESDEASFERKREFADEQSERFEEIEEERVAKDEEKRRVALVMQDVWRLRREGKFDEADELERTVL